MLSPEDRALLDFEEAHPRMTGRKQAQVRAELGVSYTRYIQLLHHLIDEPAAEREYPVLVHRLQRRRDVEAARRRSQLG